MQREARYVAGNVSCPVRLIANRQGLEGEYLASSVWADGDVVGDGVPDQPTRGIGFRRQNSQPPVRSARHQLVDTQTSILRHVLKLFRRLIR